MTKGDRTWGEAMSHQQVFLGNRRASNWKLKTTSYEARCFPRVCTCVWCVTCDVWCVCVCRLRSFSSNIFVHSACVASLNSIERQHDVTIVLTRARVPANQEHVALVADANGFRGVRQCCGVVATSVAKDFAAVSTVVLQQTWFVLISNGRTGRRRSVCKLCDER